MKVLGVLTAVVGAAIAVLAAVVAVRSAPDINRYRRIRSM